MSDLKAQREVYFFCEFIIIPYIIRLGYLLQILTLHQLSALKRPSVPRINHIPEIMISLQFLIKCETNLRYRSTGKFNYIKNYVGSIQASNGWVQLPE